LKKPRNIEDMHPLKLKKWLLCCTTVFLGFWTWSAQGYAGEGCSHLFESFCARLYAPGNNGNLKIAEGIEVNLGPSPSDFSRGYYLHEKMKLENKNKFNPDFLKILERKHHFQKLKKFLARPSRKKRTLKQATELYIELDSVVASDWSDAIDEYLLIQMNKKYPHYFNIPADNIPPEMIFERNRLRDQFNAALNTTIWGHSSYFLQIQAEFEEVRRETVLFIRESKLPPSVSERWIAKLKSVQIIPPNSKAGLSDKNCDIWLQNASYYPEHNVIMICAGYFGQDAYAVLAHELAHSIDPGNSAQDFLIHESPGVFATFSKSLSCESSKKINCKEWEMTRDASLKELENISFKNEMLNFDQCFQNRKIKPISDKNYLNQIALAESVERMEGEARDNEFLKMIKPKLPLPDGTEQTNPAYLNSCGFYPFEAEIGVFRGFALVRSIFVNEYRCNTNTEGPEKLRTSIESTKSIYQSLYAAKIRVEGSFSRAKKLQTDGYAEDVGERFADYFRSEIVARILKKYPDLQERRNRFFATNASLCEIPSLAESFPVEASAERLYYFEPHSSGIHRRQEVMRETVRSVLGCEKDFELRECYF